MKQSDMYDQNTTSNYGDANNVNEQEMGYSNGAALSNGGYHTTNGLQAGGRDSGYYEDGAVPRPKPIAGQNF